MNISTSIKRIREQEITFEEDQFSGRSILERSLLIDLADDPDLTGVVVQLDPSKNRNGFRGKVRYFAEEHILRRVLGKVKGKLGNYALLNKRDLHSLRRLSLAHYNELTVTHPSVSNPKTWIQFSYNVNGRKYDIPADYFTLTDLARRVGSGIVQHETLPSIHANHITEISKDRLRYDERSRFNQWITKELRDGDNAFTRPQERFRLQSYDSQQKKGRIIRIIYKS